MSEKIKVLFLAANPADTARLQLDEELRAIFAALREGDRSLFEVAVAPALRASELPTTILRENPDIIHYSGHGSQGEILLAADAASLAPVGAEELGRIFKTFANRTRCVVLNACFSASVADAIGASVPVVVGMSRAVPDSGACEFAAGFYSALANGGSLTQSFAAGKERLLRSGSAGDLAELKAKDQVADSLYFTGPRAQRPGAPPPRATGFAALTEQIGFEPIAKYAHANGFPSSNTVQIIEAGDITIGGQANRVSIISKGSAGNQQSGAAGAVAAHTEQKTKFGNLNVNGVGNEFTAMQDASTGHASGDEKSGAADPRQQARTQLLSLQRSVARSSELADEIKDAGNAVIAKLLTLISERAPSGDEIKKRLKSLGGMLAADPQVQSEYAGMEAELRKLL